MDEYPALVVEAVDLILVEGVGATTCHPVGECRWCDAARVVSGVEVAGIAPAMPARSEAQRRFIFARFGSAWAHAHGFANKGKLPGRIGRGGKRKGGRRRKRR